MSAAPSPTARARRRPAFLPGGGRALGAGAAALALLDRKSVV